MAHNKFYFILNYITLRLANGLNKAMKKQFELFVWRNVDLFKLRDVPFLFAIKSFYI